jgi:hypothetical protein
MKLCDLINVANPDPDSDLLKKFKVMLLILPSIYSEVSLFVNFFLINIIFYWKFYFKGVNLAKKYIF